MAGVALIPCAAQASTITWVGTLSTAWETAGNWNPSGPPTTTSAVVINSTTNTTVQLNSNVSLNATSGTNVGSLTIGSGDTLNINSGDTLTMGTHAVTLQGGSITGAGTLSGGTISGTGTVSVAAPTSNWSANSSGLTLSGGNTYTGTFGGSSGGYNLNGVTINNATLTDTSGQWNVKANSTLKGTISFNQYNTFNIGGTNGANTLNIGSTGSTSNTLNTVSGGAAPFIISTGGTLNNFSGTTTMGGGGTVTMLGGSITNTSGTGGTTAGLFTIGDPISGYGTVSGNVAIAAGNLTAGVTGSAQTLTLNGVQIGTSSSGPGIGTVGGGTLDLTGNIGAYAFNVNPGTGSVLLDGVTITGIGGSHPINNSGLTTSGTFSVANASTLSNIAFSTGNGANLAINAPLTLNGSSTLNATNVTMNGSGALNLLSTPTTGSTALTTQNLTMANGSQLVVGSKDGISLTGNFSFQQTNPASWTYNGTVGLGPDLTMTGGTSSAPKTLEVAGVNQGNVAAGFTNNFALDSLTVGKSAYIDLVGQTAGSAFYLLNLFGGAGSSITAGNYGILNLEGLFVYLLGQAGYLQDGFYTAADGTVVDIIGAPTTPLPAAAPLFAAGMGVLGFLGWRRKRKPAATA